MKRRRDPATETARDSEPRPEAIINWQVWPTLWPVVMVAWLIAVRLVLLCIAVGFTVEMLFGIRVRRSDDCDGPGPPR